MKLFIILCIMLLMLPSCAPEETEQSPLINHPQIPSIPNSPNNNNSNNDTLMSHQLQLRINDTDFIVNLEANATATAFRALLPLTLNMSELNGNEKFFNLSTNLPIATLRPGRIHAGDLMLYGSNCIVLFYKDFYSSYSYTPIGRIHNVSKLATILGSGNITIIFERKNS